MTTRSRRKQSQRLRKSAQRPRVDNSSLQLERLEERQLLAGLTLAGVLPTDGVLLQNGEIRNVAPQDLTLRFDQSVDPSTLGAIQLIRSGGDDAFASASASTDFNTDGEVSMRFDATVAGDAGNGITLIVNTNDLSSTDPSPQLSVNNNTVFIELNSNPGALTSAFDLRDTMNATPDVAALVQASITGGNAFTAIGDRSVNYSPLTLTGANTSRATADFNKPGLEIEFRSVATGTAGNGIAINFSVNNLGGAAPPQITVNDRIVNIVVNNNPGNETTALDLVTAINNDPTVNQLIRGTINSGDPLTLIGDVPPPAPLTLTGANDVTITPGFVGLGTVPSEVVVRFAEPLPDDSYLLSVSGTGANALQTPDGMVLNSGARDELIQFELDLGAQVISVVPQPITRGPDNRLTQQREKIQVFFNNDDLDRASAETPSFYQLILTQDSATTNDDEMFVPTSVTYNADADMAELTFAGAIDELAAGGAGGAWRLRIGTDEGAPLAPNRLTPAADPGSSFISALDLTGTYDTGSSLVIQGGGEVFDDGQTFTIVDQDGTSATFEFEDLSGTLVDGVEDGNVQLQYVDTLSQLQMTSQINAAISGVPGLDVVVTDNGNILSVEGDAAISLSPGLAGISLAKQGIILGGTIDNTGQPYGFDLPGGNDDIGHREIPVESHLNGGVDNIQGITTAYYNFQDVYGFDPLGNVLNNAITDIQKDRAREIFQIYGDLLGIQFVETPSSGMTVVTGDMRALDPLTPIGVGGVLGLAGGGLEGMAIMDLQDFDDTGDDLFGAAWFQTALHEIGHLLGLGHTYDLPDPTSMGSDPTQNPVPAEPIFPAQTDIIHGQHLYRPESKDIDLFKFAVNEQGVLTAETIAERLADPSLLDTVLTLYRESPDGSYELVARNDDYNSEDSLLQVELTPGTYFIGVSASGNDDYDPEVNDSGFNGVTEGDYELRLDFSSLDAANAIVDADNSPTSLDGDGDGIVGGVYNFWFKTQTPDNTFIVDKAAEPDDLAANPNLFRNIDDAIAVARFVPDSIVRIVGNGGADGDVTTVDDNQAYEIGFSQFNGVPLADGTALEVPQGVTVMVDSNAIIKLRRGRIGVGSSDTVVDRSGSAFQVLGAPRVVENGVVRRDALGEPIPGSVYFTSIHDETLGVDTDPNVNSPDPVPTDWGGIIFRRAVDKANANRFDYEDQGIFLNYVNHADIQYGGGEVVIDATGRFVSPIEMDAARATISYNTIHNNASSAVVATPDTFEETNFHEAEHQLSDEFTSDYTRVGPDVLNNSIFDNSVNGLEVRVLTPAGQQALPLTVQARLDDSTITHVLAENLRIASTPGGPIAENAAPPVRLVTLTAVPLGLGDALPAGEYTYKVVNVDANGKEGPPSNATESITLAADSAEAIQIRNLPPAHGFAARRLYRSIDGGPFVLAAQLNSFSTTFVDDGATLGGALAEFPMEVRARLDASLVVDPRVVVKVSDSIIDVGVGAQLIAEGRDGEEVIFTSIHDQRYGAGGTFNTNGDPGNLAQPGNWGGLFGWHQSTVSLEHAVVAFGGGTTRQDGGFRGFGAIEAHQSYFRLANSVVEQSADGTATIQDDRFGRGDNGPAAVFVRGNEPIIVDNIFRNNTAQAISVDVNSLSGELIEDYGGSRGEAHAFSDALGNQGALIRGNLLNNNDINGLVIRGGTLTQDGVWDDTDIVHVVFDQITVPNLHTFGGLRLESDSTESLVVKLDGATAGFVAAGQQLDIDDRVGGAVHIIGQPTKPVILTSLDDFRVGAGFTPEGQPQVNTANVDLSIYDPVTGTGLPTIGEVDNGTSIDNDVRNDIPGSFGVNPMAGGSLSFISPSPTFDIANNPLFQDNRATLQGALSGLIIDQDFVFEYLNYLDIGSNGSAVDLSTTTITTPPTLIAPDVVLSAGTVAGNNGGTITWEMQTSIASGSTRLTNTLALTSTAEFGDVQFISYLDEDLNGVSDDFLNVQGTPGDADFRAYTLDGPERVGFAQGGSYTAGAELVNATYDGWAADRFADLRSAIVGPGGTYSVPGNIDLVDLPPFTDPTLGASYGPSDITTAFAWSVDPAATEATITTFLELLPQDPGGITPFFGAPGDWQGVVLESFSHDRNVDITNEQEPQDAITGSNGTLERAEFLGQLAPKENTSDENLRLGLQVNGVLSSDNDVDYYRFDAEAGTNIVVDIDRTTHALDTRVELLAADGAVLAGSDDSTSEIDDPSLITRAGFLEASTINPLRISDFSAPDRFTTNPRDAGFAIKLPGAPGDTGPYFLRVTSGGSKGAYQMQVRLDNVDEFPGSTIRNADIRFADTGISAAGQPIHSPLSGENAEDTTNNNDSIAGSQNIGNVLESDRAAVSIAGRLSAAGDVDVYEFELSYEDVQPGTNTGLVPVVFDVDYADGLARPNTILSVFDANGDLVASTRDANISGDLPRANFGNDLTDLSRGSAGGLDPFLGPISLDVGTYYLAVTSDSQLPIDYQQFVTANPANPLARLEPNIAITRIVDEHIGGDLGTPTDPIVPSFLGAQSVVPHFLSDLVLYVSHTSPTSPNNAQLSAVNPFTGAIYTNLGNVGREIADIDFRNDDTLVAFTKDLTRGQSNNTFDDAEAGNYLSLDITGAASPLSTLLGDDGIETYELDLTDPPNEIRSHLFPPPADNRIGDGIHFEAIEVANFNSAGQAGFAVGNRPCLDIDVFTLQCDTTDDYRQPPNIFPNYNILYQFDPSDGEAFSTPAADRTDQALATGAGTNIVERGYLNTGAAVGAAFNPNLVVTAEPTVTDPSVVANIVDEVVNFVVDTGPSSPNDTFQLVSGPEFQLQMEPGTVTATQLPNIFMDGWTFELDGSIFEIDTGGVLVVERDGRFFNDGDSFTLTDLDGAAKTFEFDLNNDLSIPGAQAVPFNSALDEDGMTSRIFNAINDPALAGFTFSAELLSTPNPDFSRRISLLDTRAVSEAVADPDALLVEGQAGSVTGNPVIPIEETSTNQDFVISVLQTFNAFANFEASAEGNRVNFPGSIVGDFSGILDGATNAGVDSPIIDLGHDGIVSIPGAIAVPFGVGDSTFDLAQRITDVLNDTYVVDPVLDPAFAQVDGSGNVELLLGESFVSAVPPLEPAGDAPGGTITGVAITQVGGRDVMFAVSNRGGLYRIINPTTPRSARAIYIPTSTQLTGTEFSGLTAGPRSVENGRYANMLFATDTSGFIHAFDFNGVPQEVFVDGQSSVDTGLRFGNGSANGLVFSSLERNLWNVTPARSGDAGNGVNDIDDRLGIPNLATLHFGTGTTGDYAFPGGAYGAVESQTFSLEGYSSADQPVLYFNYYLDTENANSLAQMQDSFYVYVNDGSNNWDLVADNNSTVGGPQPLFDVGDGGAPDSWRQARVDLSAYAGLDNVQLRFEFNSGGTFEFGVPEFGGFDIRALAGSELRDGDTFTIDGTDFELEFGPTLLAPTGTNITDGQMFQIHNVVFEFDKDNDGITMGDVEIDVTNDLSPEAVALVMEAALASADYVYRADLSEAGTTNDLLTDVVDTGLLGGGDRFEATGVIGDNLGGSDVDLVKLQLNIGDVLDVNINSPGPDILDPVIRFFDDTGVPIGTPILANNATFTAPVTGTYVVGLSGVGNETYDITAAATTTTGDTGTYEMALSVNGFNGIVPRTYENRIQLDGGVKFDPQTSTVEADGAAGVTNAVPVDVHSDMTEVEVAMSIQQAIADTFANGFVDTVFRYDNVVKVLGHTLTSTGSMPGIVGALPGQGTGPSSSVTPTTPNGNVPAELRFRDNGHEGVYIDDIIIGFAERGEVATFSGGAGFFPNPLAAPNQVLTGEYQVEIRPGAETSGFTFDTNHRFEGQSATLFAPGSSELIDGQTFIISDGVASAVFEFEDVNIGNGVASGHMMIPFDPSLPDPSAPLPFPVDNEPNYVIAQRILEAINSPAIQALIDVQAGLSDGTTEVDPMLPPELNSTDWRVNLFGDFVDIGAVVPVDIGIDLSASAEFNVSGGNETLDTGTDGDNAGGISAVISGSGSIGDNPTKTGFDAPLDVDLVEVSLATGDVVSIDVDAAENGSTLDSYLRVFDITGVELFSNYQGMSPDDETATTDSYLQFIAPVSGIYYVGVSGASSDTLDIFGNPIPEGNIDYDPTMSPSGTADDATTGDYDIEIDILSGGIEVIRYDDNEFGDKNVKRDQGQLIIQNTTVSDSAGFGIDVGAGPRTGPDSDIPHQGSVRNLRELNSQNLAPGAVLANNLLVNNELGGIRFAGDSQAGAIGPVPMGRLINNTAVGNGRGDVGILVENNASPTLLNNIVADFATGVSVSADSSTTVLGGNLLAGNATPLAGIGAGQSDIITASSATLFLDAANGIYYPQTGSPAIDSSINALDERSAVTTVKAPMGIADSPILAPQRDALGQLRVDDVTGGVPGSTGGNLFVDRGAIEHADNGGPRALLIEPRDNDAAGLDSDPTISIVELPLDAVVSNFTIQLLDGVEPSDPAGGVGVNDSAVSPDQITILKDGLSLTEGVDYRFGYDPVNDVIRLTPTAGLWEPNHVYKIVMANGDQFVLTAPDGGSTVDGDTFTITDQDGGVATFEYDSGYLMTVGQTLTLQVPEEGGTLGGVTDRETFTVTNNATGVTELFEFDNNGSTGGGAVPIVFTPTMNDNEVAQQIVNALLSTDLDLQPKLIGDGQVHLGASPDHVIDLSLAPSLLSAGSNVTGGVVDGDLLLIDDGATRVLYEFDVDGTLNDSTATGLAFNYGLTHLEITQLIADRVAADTSLSPSNLGDGRLHLGGNRVTVVDPSLSQLTVTGTPGVFSEFGIQIPSEAGVPVGITDGMTFQVGDGLALPVTFEFDDDGNFVLGNTLIPFTSTTTLDELTNAVASQISSVGIGLSPANVGNGFIELGNDTPIHVFNPLASVLVQTGTPGVDGNQAIPFVPDVSFTGVDMAAVITTAINNSDLNSVATQRADDVLVTNVDTITGIVDAFVESIRDYAGNVLQANQSDGTTEFTIIFGDGLDFGDAEQLPTLEQFNGARHTVVDGYSLGLDVDVDPDGQPTPNADGDDNSSRDDEDGVTHDGIVPGFVTNFTVTAQGITGNRPGFLDAWVDWDGDGVLEPTEKIADSMVLTNGANTISMTIPSGVSVGDAVARFRLSSTGGLGVDGAAIDGEVEDYLFEVTPSTWTNPANRYDVFPDGVMTPFDLLKVLQFLQLVGAAPVPKSGPLNVPAAGGGVFHFEAPPVSPYYDVNQDRMVSLSDLRDVFVNLSQGGEGESGSEAAEGEALSYNASGNAGPWAAPLQTEPLVREIQFQLTPPPEALGDDQSTESLEDTLPLDEVVGDLANNISSYGDAEHEEVDDFFAQLDE